MNQEWKIKDVIDLEFFLAEESGEENRADEDRLLTGGISSPREKIRLWVEARRRATGDPDSTPGAVFEQAYHSLLMLLALVGAVAGAMVVSAHLYYSGGRPINALVFFTVTVVSQLLILAMLGVGWLWRSRLGSVRWVVAWLLLRMAEAREKAMERVGGARRLHAKALWGAIRAKWAIYGSLPLWPVLILTQTFAVCFNLGILVSILVQVAVSNRAFGWESTLQISADAVHRMVEAIALPWSWIAPHAHPTLEQVRESRIAIQGGASYPTEALISWWPFLCYAVLVYGLLPRLLLLVLAYRQRQRALGALSFDHADCSQLLRRLEPVVVAGPAGPPQEPGSAATSPPPRATMEGARCVAVASRDLPAALLEESVERFGWKIGQRLDAEIDNAEASKPLFAKLGSLTKIAVFAEESQPPIRAILKFLRELRGATGAGAEILVLLLPDGTPENTETWKRVLAGLGDPYLSVERVP